MGWWTQATRRTKEGQIKKLGPSHREAHIRSPTCPWGLKASPTNLRRTPRPKDFRSSGNIQQVVLIMRGGTAATYAPTHNENTGRSKQKSNKQSKWPMSSTRNPWVLASNRPIKTKKRQFRRSLRITYLPWVQPFANRCRCQARRRWTSTSRPLQSQVPCSLNNQT